MLRCSAASTWICCCTWVTEARCSLAAFWAWRSASSSAAGGGLLFALRRQHLGRLLLGGRRSSRPGLQLGLAASWLRVDH
jgi:hypothetical protein